MAEKKITFLENLRGQHLVGRTYLIFKSQAEEQIAKDDDLTDDDLDDVIIGLLITKLLVTEGRLEEKFWDSAIS